MRASCVGDLEALPATRLKVVGIAEFPFQTTNETTTGGTLDALKAACGGNVGDEADLILVTSTGDADETAAAIRAAAPGDQSRDQRRSCRPAPADRLHVLPADLDRADDGDRVVCRAADHRAADGLGEPAARRDRGAARARLLARARGRRRAVGVGADRRHRRAALAAAWPARWRRASTASSRECRAFPSRCTSSSSRRRRSPFTSRCSSRRPSSRRSIRCASCRRCRSPRRCATR